MPLKERQFSRITEARQKLIETAAHDLRNPVAAILAYNELLAEDLGATASAEQTEMMDAIRSAGRFMLRLVNDTMDVLAGESGAVRFHAVRATVAPIVADSVSLHLPLAANKLMRLGLVQEGDPLPVLLDSVKIGKVLNNLIGNAIRHCNPGTRIEVRVSRGVKTMIVSVKDNGPGIDPADLKTLFTPFQRTRASALSEEPAAGLGLAIAKQIVDLHGGRIWAESQVGRGSTFFVALPAAS